MEDTRRAIRQGRVLADEGLYERAKETWKAVLSDAYSSQDYAGLFVLSGNIGEVCVRNATQEKDSVKAMELLHEAKENLEYALQIVEQCSLREVLGGYKALYQGVRRAETLRRKAGKLMEKLKQDELKKVELRGEVTACTTCGVAGGDNVLDENDGCYYCKKCYSEYYAAVEEDGEESAMAAGNGTGEEPDDPDELDTEKRSILDAALGDEDKEGNGGAEIAALELDPIDEPYEVVSVESEGLQKDQETQKKVKEMDKDRIRYERVELGSLADFLAGNLSEENKMGQLELQKNMVSGDLPVPLAAAPTDPSLHKGEEATKVSVDGIDDGNESHSEADTTASDDVAAYAEEAPVQDDDDNATDTTADKREYSIAQLLEIRKNSPIDCPPSLLASPVRDDGTVPTPSRPKANNSRKKPNAKKTARSAASQKEFRADVTDRNQVSLLPSLALCNVLRQTYQEHQETAASSGTMDTGLFGSKPGTLPFTTHVHHVCSGT